MRRLGSSHGVLGSSRAGLFAGALVGLIVALIGLDPLFIAGTGGKWLRPEDDFASYLVAWNYYVADAWRFPLFSVPGMGYPEGGSVLFTDALPLGALLSKILYGLSGLRVNPLGWWILLTHVLQGVMAARLVRATGVRSVVASAAAATFAICSTAFLYRMGHVGLSSHFLVLWALALYFEMVRAAPARTGEMAREGRARTGELTLALALALLVNAYLFAMVAAIGGIALLTLWLKGVLSSRDAAAAAVGAFVVLGIGLIAGYGVMFTHPTSMQAFGFSVFSWNPATLVLPREGLPGFLAGVSRDATGGQYEGDAYVGQGVLVVLALSALWSPRRTLEQLRRHWPLCLLLLAFAVYAASHRLYIGSRLLVAYELPSVVLELCSYFRASGRFIWPVAYALAVLPLACLFKWWRPVPAALIALVAVALQVSEAMPFVEDRRRSTARPYLDMLADSPVPSWIAAHQRLWMYPAWPCGGLGPVRRRWGGPEANRELQVELVASRANVPTNSVYTSRLLKDCQAEAAWASQPELQPDVLYLVSLESVDDSPALTRLARSAACTRLPWVVACSTAWRQP